MGLDMYLHARKYVGKFFGEAEEWDALKKMLGDLPGDDCYTMSKEVVYWRKANQIHSWFVQNVQNGEDECREHYVPQEKLIELRELCATLLASRDVEQAKKELPPQSGFFFGSTEFDEYYWDDLNHTVSQLDILLNHPRLNQFNLYYRSSW